MARKHPRARGLRESFSPNTENELEGGPGRQKQRWPGRTEAMRPRPDHGEDSYRGAHKLEGKVALITGGDSGIGRAVAIAYAREGADVAIAYYDEHDDAETTITWVQEAGRRALALPGDLGEYQHRRKVTLDTVRELGRLDILVNNAAFQMERKSIAEITPDQLDRTFRTNFFAYFWLAQAALEHMKEGAVILDTGSITAMQGNEGRARRLPESVSDDDAILLSDIFPTGYFGADLAEIDDGDTVAVFGCGPVGQFTILSASLLGAGRILAVDSEHSRLDLAQSTGAEVINFEDENPVDALQELTGGSGVDRAIDAVGVDASHPHNGPAADDAEKRRSDTKGRC